MAPTDHTALNDAKPLYNTSLSVLLTNRRQIPSSGAQFIFDGMLKQYPNFPLHWRLLLNKPWSRQSHKPFLDLHDIFSLIGAVSSAPTTLPLCSILGAFSRHALNFLYLHVFYLSSTFFLLRGSLLCIDSLATQCSPDLFRSPYSLICSDLLSHPAWSLICSGLSSWQFHLHQSNPLTYSASSMRV